MPQMMMMIIIIIIIVNFDGALCRLSEAPQFFVYHYLEEMSLQPALEEFKLG